MRYVKHLLFGGLVVVAVAACAGESPTAPIRRTPVKMAKFYEWNCTGMVIRTGVNEPPYPECEPIT